MNKKLFFLSLVLLAVFANMAVGVPLQAAENQAPVADADGPYFAAPGVDIILNGSWSDDPDQATGDYIAEYIWDLDNDGIFEDYFGPNPTIPGFVTGDYPSGTIIPLSLRVTDSYGATSEASSSITITTDAGPMASFTVSPRLVYINQPIVIDASISYSGSNAYLYNYNWNIISSNSIIVKTHSSTIPTFTYSFSSPGEYLIELEVFDTNGNSGTTAHFISVYNDPNVDTTPPVITAPEDLTVPADPGAAVAANIELGTPAVSDNSGGEVIVANDAPAEFPIGTTSVTWTATDESGNTAEAVQQVTVIDTEPPVIVPPDDINIEQEGPDSTVISLEYPVVIDNADPSPVIDCDAPPVFPPGDTIVIWTATDASGNSANVSQTITVEDTTGPVVTITSPVDGGSISCDMDVDLEYTATDACDDSLAVEVISSGPLTAPLTPGDLTITVEAADKAGNTGSASVTITVTDNDNNTEEATVDVEQDIIDLKASCKPIAVYIEVPGKDVHQIDVKTIKLNGIVPAYQDKQGVSIFCANISKIGDYDEDGIPDLKVKFNCNAVKEILEVGDNVEITITGEVEGVAFSGNDYVKVISEKKAKPIPPFKKPICDNDKKAKPMPGKGIKPSPKNEVKPSKKYYKISSKDFKKHKKAYDIKSRGKKSDSQRKNSW
ncbi:MAG: HYR domain-containing protein [Dehalococcoidales bacterium]|nr:HYR domain-containing protein [Dehalococcoidales bacterium]